MRNRSVQGADAGDKMQKTAQSEIPIEGVASKPKIRIWAENIKSEFAKCDEGPSKSSMARKGKRCARTMSIDDLGLYIGIIGGERVNQESATLIVSRPTVRKR